MVDHALQPGHYPVQDLIFPFQNIAGGNILPLDCGECLILMDPRTDELLFGSYHWLVMEQRWWAELVRQFRRGGRASLRQVAVVHCYGSADVC